MSVKQLVETIRGKPIDKLLRELYVEKDMTMLQIANELKVSVGTIHNWLIEYKIDKPKE